MPVARRYLALLNSYRLKYLSRLPQRMTSSMEKEETQVPTEVHCDSRYEAAALTPAQSLEYLS